MDRSILKRCISALLAAMVLLAAAGCDDIEKSLEDKVNGHSASTKADDADDGEDGADENNADDGEDGADENDADDGEDEGEDDEDTEVECPYEYSISHLRNISAFTNLEEYYTDTHLNPEEVYKNLTYTPQMFFGKYIREDFLDGDGYFSSDSVDFDKFVKSTEWRTMYSFDEYSKKGEEIEVSAVPIEVRAGSHSASYKLRNVKKYNWMTLTFAWKRDEDRYSTADITGVYYVKDGKLSFTPLNSMEKDEKTYEVTKYSLTDQVYEFDFEFSGTNLTISSGNSSSAMVARDFCERGNSDSYWLWNYSSSKERIDDIVGFEISGYKEYDADHIGRFGVKIDNKRGYYDNYSNVVGHFNENGILNFSWADIDGTKHAYEFVYFYCGDDGLVLTDGEHTYFYNYDYTEFSLGADADSEDSAVEGLSQDTLAAIAQKKSSLQDELMKAFEAEGINVELNDETGEMMLDSSILFDVDKYDLSDGGKDYLKKFIKAYSSVILKDDYEGFVSKIMVEGHTDSTGERAHNEELSQKRADEVKKYCLSSEVGMDATAQKEMGDLMEAVGYADDYPVLDAGGMEDKEKSRRVSFKFVIDMENASTLKLPDSDTAAAND